MAKFIYKMQSILDIKYKLETQAKSEYSAAMAELQWERVKLENIFADIKKYEDTLRENNSGILNILEIKAVNDAIAYKKDEAETQKIVIQRAEKKADRAKAKLNEVMVDRKTHEKLREKAFAEFLRETSEQEMKEVDEVVSFQYNNQDAGGN